jgi:hypothetical protein
MNSMDSVKSKWADDFAAVEQFCAKYGLGWGQVVEHEEKFSVFFIDEDTDAIQCCMTKNVGDLSGKPSVDHEYIIVFIPMNEMDPSTDICRELLTFITENKIISI